MGISFHKHGYSSYSVQWCLGYTLVGDDEGSVNCINIWPPEFKHETTRYLGPIEYWYGLENGQ